MDFGNRLAFIDRLSNHERLRIDVETVQGSYRAAFDTSGFLGAYRSVRTECFPDSIPHDFPSSPTGWTRFNFSLDYLYNAHSRDSYSPAPQGVYVETVDEVSGDIYRFHVNCTDPGFEYVWSRITWLTPSPDEDAMRKLSNQVLTEDFSIGVEIDGKINTAQDWTVLWNSGGYSGPGAPRGDVAIRELVDHDDSYGLLLEMYRSDAREVVFILSWDEHNARLPFNVTGFQEAFQPMLDHCELRIGNPGN